MTTAYGSGYRRARSGAFQRSNGRCQFCGRRPAVQGHHWANEYPADEIVGADDITALCNICHTIATRLRTHERGGGDVWTFLAALKEAVTHG